MTILQIYEKVNMVTPVEQKRFFSLFNDTVAELISLYEKPVIATGKAFVPISDLHDENVVLPLYTNSIVDNILFALGADASYKSEFIRKSKEAYTTYWNENAKGRHIKRMRW